MISRGNLYIFGYKVYQKDENGCLLMANFSFLLRGGGGGVILKICTAVFIFLINTCPNHRFLSR